MRVRLVGLLALMALVLASCGGVSPDAAGPSEGIQVHGDWTIDIYNEDGSLERHVEFDNSLDFGGSLYLAELLAGVSSVGNWTIEFFELSGNVCPSTALGNCIIQATVSTEDLDPVGPAGAVDTVRLTGSAIVEADGVIDQVATRFATCAADVAPDSCSSDPASNYAFTGKALDAADQRSVSAGQTVQVQVDISFTSGS